MNIRFFFVLCACARLTTGAVVGSLDAAGDDDGGSSIPRGAVLHVRGWAVDATSGASINTVTVFIDGTSVGTATTGALREDVAQAHQRIEYTNCGWTFELPTSNLAAGTHSVSVVAAGPSGSAQLGSKTVTIKPPNAGRIIGSIESAADSAGVSTVPKGVSLWVRGWATDTMAGAPVKDVVVHLDGRALGHAELGLARADIEQTHGSKDYSSGWYFPIVSSKLPAGPHTFTATATGESGTAQLLGSKTVIVIGGGGELIGSVQSAADRDGDTGIVKPKSLIVQGWAEDTVDEAPARTVTIYVDGDKVGTATPGIEEKDSLAKSTDGTAHRDHPNSRWTFKMSTASLSEGSHSVTATASGPTQSSPLVGTKTVDITAPAAPGEIGWVDVAELNGATLSVHGWAADTLAGAPVQLVTIFVDGRPVGAATLGAARVDVARALERDEYLDSGWSFQLSTGSLTRGPHSITAAALGPSASGQLAGSETITIP